VRFLTLEEVASGVKSKAFIMTLESIASRWYQEDGLKQVYDANLDKWLSMKRHKEEVEAFWKSVSGEDTAEHYIKHYYSNILENFYSDKGGKVNKYVCFFIAPATYGVDEDEVCGICNNIGYIQCDECQDFNGITICDVCDDATVVECFSCNSYQTYEFLVGAVSWYSFKTPYLEDSNKSIYIDSLINFGTYEFIDVDSTHAGGGIYALNDTEVEDDVTSAYIWSKLCEKIPEIGGIVNEKGISSSYYGFIPKYDNLIDRIGHTINIKMTNSLGTGGF
tara:strand:+ start:2334 stop:3167 length:834 start_codon:yes stop_codon:yes gene_type:complete